MLDWSSKARMASLRKKSDVIELPAYGSDFRAVERKQSIKATASGVREEDVVENVDALKRSLTNRQLQLIAIGGSIGTALFVTIGGRYILAGILLPIVYC